MKENINNLTGLLIVVSVSVLSYHYINKEDLEYPEQPGIIEESTEKIIEKVETVEIESECVDIKEVTPVSQVVISGKITWPINRETRFFTRDTSITTYVDWIGKFNLTFPLDSSGYLTFHHGMETTAMYCNPDDTIHITINTKKFDETITYTGSIESNYLAWKYLYEEGTAVGGDVYNNTAEELSSLIDSFVSPMIVELNRINMNNTNFYDSELKEMNQIKEYVLKRHEQVKNLPKAGEEAINFTYPDKDSNLISLSDFKGSYVYVDVWATWCGPCRYEIPFLLQLEEDYHDANIVFMSVSVDTENAKQKWIDMIKDENMGGVQLISTDGWKSQIMKDYAINGIPRFMLFDREGNVISVDAPRPSSDEIRKIFMSFEIVEGLESEGIEVIEVIEVIDVPKEL